MLATAYLDSSLETQNDANRGNRLTLTPKYSPRLTVRLPRNLTIGGGIRRPTRSSSTRQTRSSRQATPVDGLIILVNRTAARRT